MIYTCVYSAYMYIYMAYMYRLSPVLLCTSSHLAEPLRQALAHRAQLLQLLALLAASGLQRLEAAVELRQPQLQALAALLLQPFRGGHRGFQLRQAFGALRALSHAAVQPRLQLPLQRFKKPWKNP